MRVLLITPPYYVPLSTFAISVGQPLGICYVGASLRAQGHEVMLIDGLMEGRVRDVAPGDLKGDEPGMIRISRGVFQRATLGPEFPAGAVSIGMSFDEIEARIRAFKPDVVGISCIFTSIYRTGAYVAKLAKRIDPNIITIMGGTHVTVTPQTVLTDPSIDYIVTGEGEKVICTLLDAIAQRHDVSAIAGVGYRKPDGTQHHIPAELDWELDELPMPAFDLLKMEDYFATMAEGRAGKMYTTRGCPFACSFCSVPLTSKRRFRVHSIERIITEARAWKDIYGVETLIFEDDNINTNAKRFRGMLQGFIDAEINVQLDARNLRCDLLDDEMLRLMKGSGFATVWITPESGSQRVMDEIINKKMKVSESRDAARRIIESGLEVGAAFVIGFPGEKRDEIQTTIDYAYDLKSMGVNNFWFSIATPIEGTALYQRALDDGLISGIDLDKFTYNTATFDTDEFTADELMDWRAKLMKGLNDGASASCGKPMLAEGIA
jgi:magnesium-protoporphyrin IX monomethyl ester (oxidative) cyclase